MGLTLSGTPAPAWCRSISTTSGWIWTTATSVPSSLAYSLNAKQPRLVRLDEIDEARHSRLLLIELSWLESVGGDEDERSRHGASFVR
jgi:hypothetical protein